MLNTEVVTAHSFGHPLNRGAARHKPTVTRDQLPPADTKRWVAARKAIVVEAIRAGVLTRAEAKLRYAISEEELLLWENAIATVGARGLRVTHLQRYRAIFGNTAATSSADTAAR